MCSTKSLKYVCRYVITGMHRYIASYLAMCVPFSGKFWQRKVWQIDSFQTFAKESLVDQPIL